MEIKVSTLAEAYKKSIQYIIWNHGNVITEDNEKVWRSKESILIHVSEPYRDLDTLISYYPMGKYGINTYVDELMGIDDRETKGGINDFAYTYYDRLFHYDSVDQINEIIDKINSSPDTRRAIAITWKPYDDNNINAKSPPCLQWLKCDVVKDCLNMYTVWRSRDVLLGMGANIYALHHLHSYIAKLTGYKIGFYEDISFDAHIYYESQGNYLKRWL